MLPAEEALALLRHFSTRLQDGSEASVPADETARLASAIDTVLEKLTAGQTRSAAPLPSDGGLAASPLSIEQAFEIGFCWRGMLVGQTREDSRAVCRTLAADLFDGLDIDDSEVPGFESADVGIHHAKRAILHALRVKAISSAVPSVVLRMADAGHELAQYASYAEIVGAICHNRKPIREWADKVFALHHERQDLEFGSHTVS